MFVNSGWGTKPLSHLLTLYSPDHTCTEVRLPQAIQMQPTSLPTSLLSPSPCRAQRRDVGGMRYQNWQAQSRCERQACCTLAGTQARAERQTGRKMVLLDQHRQLPCSVDSADMPCCLQWGGRGKSLGTDDFIRQCARVYDANVEDDRRCGVIPEG
jgi:hypothetical protein